MTKSPGDSSDCPTMLSTKSPQVTPCVFVIDDDKAIRDSFSELAKAMNLAARTFESAEAFLDEVDLTWRGCIIADVRMPGLSGIQLQERLAKDGNQLPMIVISGHGDIPMCVEALKKGALDFLEKPCRPDQLRRCIRTAIEVDNQRYQESVRQGKLKADLANLTTAEKEVLQGMISGSTNRQIATQLDVSLRTVQLRRSSLMSKLNIDSIAEVIKYAESFDKSD